MGSVYAYVAHPELGDFLYDSSLGTNADAKWGAWELLLMGKLQFTEQLGFDIGAQAFLGELFFTFLRDYPQKN